MIDFLIEKESKDDTEEIDVNGRIIKKQKLKMTESAEKATESAEKAMESAEKANCRYEGTDAFGYSYYRAKDCSLEVYDGDEINVKIYPSAFDYKDSIFYDAVLVKNPLCENEAVMNMITQYGGKCVQN